jgi:predicted RNA-binding Zn-ribbon protein involved in translation (DUF1610 family)
MGADSVNGRSPGWDGGVCHRSAEDIFCDLGLVGGEAAGMAGLGIPAANEYPASDDDSGPDSTDSGSPAFTSMAGGGRCRIEPRVPRVSREGGDGSSPLERPLGFNCPACGVVLVVRKPDDYDGGPAPCPRCGVQILPPRIVHSTATFDLHPMPGLSVPGRVLKSPRPLHRVDRRG